MPLQEVSIYLRPFGEIEAYRIDGRLKGGSKPNYDDNSTNQLLKFNLSFSEPVNPDGDLIDIKNGDEIFITNDSERLDIFDYLLAGKVYRRQKTPNGLLSAGKFTFNLNIRQHDFSGYKKFNLLYPTATDLETYLNDIFLNPEYPTKEILGGVLTDGTVIDKYVLLSENVELPPFEHKNSHIGHLNNATDLVSYKWREVFYCEPDETTGINVISQVEIW